LNKGSVAGYVNRMKTKYTAHHLKSPAVIGGMQI